MLFLPLWMACSTSEPEPPPAAPAPAEDEGVRRKAKSKKHGGQEGQAAATYTLVGLEMGDAACYVQLKDADGKEQSLHGDFDLCPGSPKDASAMIGKTVSAEIRKEEVMADSCQGNPECADREKVDFVASLKASP